MNVKISVFVICVEVIVHLLLYNLHDCTFKIFLKWNYPDFPICCNSDVGKTIKSHFTKIFKSGNLPLDTQFRTCPNLKNHELPQLHLLRFTKLYHLTHNKKS